MPGELGIPLGCFGESKAVQLRVDLYRLHADIIPSRMETPSLPVPVRDIMSSITLHFLTAPYGARAAEFRDTDYAPQADS
jgi:hypothetical protein